MHSFRFASSLFAACLLMGASSMEAAQPQAVNVSPTSGSGTSQTFTLTASDSDGAADVSGMNLLIGGPTLNGSNS
ncbi:MAG TPA: hypothetical protein VHC90_23940, partial [Bryobacteraceae bacterium]|nr:hypothetical protein [Bryobacteraceae bacterium]